MSLTIERIEVRSPVEGVEPRSALLAKCGECQNETFVVFQIEGQEPPHFHLQCAACGTSYCPQGGACHTSEMRAER